MDKLKTRAVLLIIAFFLISTQAIAQDNHSTGGRSYDKIVVVLICSGSNGCRTGDYGLGHTYPTANGDCHFHQEFASLSGEEATFFELDREGILGNAAEFKIHFIGHHPSFPAANVKRNIMVCGATPDASDRRARLSIGVKYK